MMADRNKRAHIHHPNTFGQRAADTIANSMGSWPFIIWQSAIVGVWVVLNILGFIRHWDPYPFILLNLLFSTQAAYAAPIIMMSQNRQAQKDHLRDDHEAAEVELLFTINQRQLEILQLLQAGIDPNGADKGDGDPALRAKTAKLQDEARELASEISGNASS